jgi:CheY-like chemotaxis protein
MNSPAVWCKTASQYGHVAPVQQVWLWGCEAGDGKEAIKLLSEETHFDLLFTDIILPGGINGIEIADEALRLQPDIKILYATGYAESAIGETILSSVHNNLLNKPYSRVTLLNTVKTILNSD